MGQSSSRLTLALLPSSPTLRCTLHNRSFGHVCRLSVPRASAAAASAKLVLLDFALLFGESMHDVAGALARGPMIIVENGSR